MLNHSSKQCYGCTACMNACPKNCISMQEDSEGFLYPHIDQEICVRCGVCETVCPIYTYAPPQSGTSTAYAAINLSDGVRDKSSSGGIFSLLATYILNKQGIIFGAVLDDNLEVKHISVSSHEELYKLQGSKYVQSDIRGIYKQVKAYLKQGKYVLFSGTPCQVEGLRLFLKSNYQSLFLVDIICHGVPSPLVWREYLNYIVHKFKKEIKYIYFRDKKNGWLNFCLSIHFADNSIEYINRSNDYFFRAFLHNISLRPCCSACLFKHKNRNSDITLADFWGIEHIFPAMHDDHGTSLILVHSKKGQELLHAIENKICYKSVALDIAAQYNSAMTRSVAAHPKRNKFFSSLGTLPFNELVIKYCTDSDRYKKSIRNILKKLHLLEIAKHIRNHINR